MTDGGMSRPPGRRSVLGALGACSLAGLAGCGLLSDDTSSPLNGGDSGTVPEGFGTSELRPPEVDVNDRFGSAIAADGTTVVVGAALDEHPDEPTPTADRRFHDGKGAVYVFDWRGGEWIQTARLTPEGTRTASRFGSSVAIENDTLLVGARNTAHSDHYKGGAAHVYRREGDGWHEAAVLAPDDPEKGMRFGLRVALDGDLAAVGSEGGAYIFERSGEDWPQTGELVPTDQGGDSDDFGTAVATSDETILVGARRADEGENQNAGAAYIFERESDGWAQTAKLMPADSRPFGTFGTAVALDGDTALIGAPGWKSKHERIPGTAYIFERSSDGWTQSAELPADRKSHLAEKFGQSVAVGPGTALVASPWSANGLVYVFERESNSWTETRRLTQPGEPQNDYFGTAVMLATGTVVVANENGNTNGKQSGSVVLFEH